MVKQDIMIRSSEGPEFACYLAIPQTEHAVPGIVLASAIYGVDDDIRAVADDFASRGYIAAAPDLVWRTLPGPLPHGDPRAAQRSQPRLEKLRIGERDLTDVLAALRMQPKYNGRAAVIGFCYSGPYAIVAPKRLGYDAGIACHGTQMLDFIDELEDVQQPVRILWGDRDEMAPVNVREAYSARSARVRNVEVCSFPGVQHGYMMQANAKAFDRKAYDVSMSCALAILECLEKMPSDSPLRNAD